ncbi:MAG: hypothetical protein MHM6MM_007910 [Cercozoa sp. M6MM]
MMEVEHHSDPLSAPTSGPRPWSEWPAVNDSGLDINRLLRHLPLYLEKLRTAVFTEYSLQIPEQMHEWLTQDDLTQEDCR